MAAELHSHECAGVRWHEIRPNNPDSPDRLAFIDPDDLAALVERVEWAEAAVARVRRLPGDREWNDSELHHQRAMILAALDHDCDPPDDPAHDSPREWACPTCKTAWDRVEHSEDEGEIYETWYEKRNDPEESRG